jgi:hypothetical protein
MHTYILLLFFALSQNERTSSKFRDISHWPIFLPHRFAAFLQRYLLPHNFSLTFSKAMENQLQTTVASEDMEAIFSMLPQLSLFVGITAFLSETADRSSLHCQALVSLHLSMLHTLQAIQKRIVNGIQRQKAQQSPTKSTLVLSSKRFGMATTLDAAFSKVDTLLLVPAQVLIDALPRTSIGANLKLFNFGTFFVCLFVCFLRRDKFLLLHFFFKYFWTIADSSSVDSLILGLLRLQYLRYHISALRHSWEQQSDPKASIVPIIPTLVHNASTLR